MRSTGGKMHSRLIGQRSTLHYAIWHVRCFNNARNGQERLRGTSMRTIREDTGGCSTQQPER